VDYEHLNWIEAFSASKAGNFTGWRIGAAIGSKKFMMDFKKIKGNSDSGFNAALAAGVLHQFTEGRQEIDDYAHTLKVRLDALKEILDHDAGFNIPAEPQAGFFILCDAPKEAFEVKVETAEQFNNLMIDKTGVVGVPFDDGDCHWIRYAVCTQDILNHNIQSRLRDAFTKAQVGY
jgi:aspartate/methionine/tyrosine aminotransferase